jgi:hypothetical protein
MCSVKTVWTNAMLEDLERLWREGASAGTIRDALGLDTRHQVTGKLWRLGLVRSDARSGASRAAARAGRKAGRRRPRRLVLPPANGEAPARARIVLLSALGPGECRWPLSSPPAEHADLTLFCGAQIEDRPRRARRPQVYCSAHAPLSRIQRGRA